MAVICRLLDASRKRLVIDQYLVTIETNILLKIFQTSVQRRHYNQR